MGRRSDGREESAHRRATQLTSEGLLPGVDYRPSPNCDDRPADEPIRLLVIHAISLPPGQFGGDGIARLFANCLDPEQHPYYREIQALRVSAHFLIRRRGEMIQFVPCRMRAWHAGVSQWRSRQCWCLVASPLQSGCGGSAANGCCMLRFSFTAPQYRRLVALTEVLRHHYPIEDIVGHSDIAPGRKTDPGPFFDWSRFHRMLIR